MLYRELRPGGTEHAALLAVKQASTLEQATEVFMDKFERPNPDFARLDVRINWAKKALAAYVAAGSPVTLPPAPTLQPAQDVLSPLTKMPPPDLTALAPIINAALPILLQLLTARAQGTTGAQPGQGIDLQAFLRQLLGDAPQPAAPPVPPPAPVVVATPASPPKTGLALSLAGLFASFGAMATGHLGTPLGMGPEPTTAGNLVPLAFTAAAAIASTGVFGPVGAAIGRVMGAVGPALTNKPKS
jgi:hypothetical protein